MLQLIAANEAIRRKRLTTEQRWVYLISFSELVLEIQDIITVTEATVSPSNSGGLFINSFNTDYEHSWSQITFSNDMYEDRISILEHEVQQLRDLINHIIRSLDGRQIR